MYSYCIYIDRSGEKTINKAKSSRSQVRYVEEC